MTAQPFKTIVLDLLQQGHLDEAACLQELGETERTAIGTLERWSAKDHVAHRTFWHQDLILKVTAILQHQEVPPSEESDDWIERNEVDSIEVAPGACLAFVATWTLPAFELTGCYSGSNAHGGDSSTGHVRG
jgi:hypothetical protein